MKTFVTFALAALAGTALAQEATPPRGDGMMMRADANGDGVVTRAEMLAQAGERFDRMDLNRDGKLTQDELQQGFRAGSRRSGDMPPAPPPAN